MHIISNIMLLRLLASIPIVIVDFTFIKEFISTGTRVICLQFLFFSLCNLSRFRVLFCYPRRILKKKTLYINKKQRKHHIHKKKSCRKFEKKKVCVWSLNANLRQLEVFFLEKIFYTNLLYKSIIQIYYPNLLFKFVIQICYSSLLSKSVIQICYPNLFLKSITEICYWVCDN